MGVQFIFKKYLEKLIGTEGMVNNKLKAVIMALKKKLIMALSKIKNQLIVAT